MARRTARHASPTAAAGLLHPVPATIARASVAAAFLVLYLATLPSNVYWDGLTFALHIDLFEASGRGGARLLHPNHLLFTPLMLWLTRAVHVVAPDAGTLTILQVSSAFLSVTALWTVAKLADKLTCNDRVGTVAMTLLGCSAGWWGISGDATAYVLSTWLLVMSILSAMAARPSALRTGSWLAAAMLVHQLAFLGSLAVLVTCVRRREWRWGSACAAVAWAWAASVATYVGLAAAWNRADGITGIVAWSVSNPGQVALRRDPVAGFWMSLRSQTEAIVASGLEELFDGSGWKLAALLSCLAVVAATCTAVALARPGAPRLRSGATADRPSNVAPLALFVVWTAPYTVFLLFWEPWFVSYRAFALPAFAFLGACGAEWLECRFSGAVRAVPSAVVACLLVVNFVVSVGPRMDPDSNPRVAGAIAAREHWDGRTVVVAAGLTDVDTTFRYFNPQARWFIADRRDAEQRAATVVAVAGAWKSRGFDVWLSDGAATLIGIEPPDLERTITLLDARASTQQIRFVRYP